ncbi:MAG: ABC transporter permease [Terracidiphilus sp.]
MIFLKLIVTNLRRHHIRSLISVAGIAFSVAAMLTVVTILQGAIGMFSRILSNDSEIIVFERDVSDLFFSNVPADVASQISRWPIVAHANPVLFGIVSSEGHPIITCFGVTSTDARIQKAEWLEGDRSKFGQQTDGVVLGTRAAQFLSASVGSQVQIGHRSFRVIGVLKTANGFEDGGVFMPLASAQLFFHKEGTSSVITVKLRDKDAVTNFKNMIATKYPSLIALEDSEFTRSYSQFRILKATAWAVGGCGLLLGGLGVANTMIMSVFTRIREVAILRVNGFSHIQIGGVIFGESTVVSVSGAMTGLIIGTCFLYALKLIPALDGYVDTNLHPLLMLVVLLLAVLTGVAGALYPALYAMRIRAVEALRFE